MFRLTLSLLIAAALALSACGGDDDEPTTADTSAPDPNATPCATVETPPRMQVDLDKPPAKPSADDLTAVVSTSCGDFTIALDTKNSPKTVASFEYLAEEGVYDNTSWHRIVPGFVIQGGDPLGDGTGGPGYSVQEAPPNNTSYTEGVVAMAKSEVEPPGTSGSQFFVVTGADAGLPPDYAVLGEVTEGMEVVDLIDSFGDPSGQTQAPLEPVIIESVTIQ